MTILPMMTGTCVSQGLDPQCIGQTGMEAERTDTGVYSTPHRYGQSQHYEAFHFVLHFLDFHASMQVVDHVFLPGGGRNSLLVVCWAHCLGFDPPLRRMFPVEGIFPLELTWVLTPFSKNSFG